MAKMKKDKPQMPPSFQDLKHWLVVNEEKRHPDAIFLIPMASIAGIQLTQHGRSKVTTDRTTYYLSTEDTAQLLSKLQ